MNSLFKKMLSSFIFLIFTSGGSIFSMITSEEKDDKNIVLLATTNKQQLEYLLRFMETDLVPNVNSEFVKKYKLLVENFVRKLEYITKVLSDSEKEKLSALREGKSSFLYREKNLKEGCLNLELLNMNWYNELSEESLRERVYAFFENEDNGYCNCLLEWMNDFDVFVHIANILEERENENAQKVANRLNIRLCKLREFQERHTDDLVKLIAEMTINQSRGLLNLK